LVRLLPRRPQGCQDTGTAIVMGKKGQDIWTDGRDASHLSEGIYNSYTRGNLRYSQVAPQTMFEEKNTGTNLPAQIDLYAGKDTGAYELLLFTKGGGSANKTFLFQETKRLLNEASLAEFVRTKIQTLGTSACPPYHLALVIGGTSAEMNLKTVKLASARYLDSMPTSGNAHGRAYRDLEWEARVMETAMDLGIGSQLGGRFFCHDARVIRLPRHGASCPVGLGVSCSADRQICGKIDETGVYVEALERDPAQYLPDPEAIGRVTTDVANINLDMPMEDIRRELGRHPVGTRISLTGTIIVARDIAHAKFKERLDRGEGLPEYLRKYPVYYAGPAKTPEGKVSGSFGPTTSSRMDPYCAELQAAGGSLVMLAKGNRSRAVTKSCKEHGGFYLVSVGGPAAILAQDCITKLEVVEYEELGMEAVWKIEGCVHRVVFVLVLVFVFVFFQFFFFVCFFFFFFFFFCLFCANNSLHSQFSPIVKDFPCMVAVDDKGNDFYAKWSGN
jgi:fumarate hydratase class I